MARSLLDFKHKSYFEAVHWFSAVFGLLRYDSGLNRAKVKNVISRGKNAGNPRGKFVMVEDVLQLLGHINLKLQK